jgi:hypothetical protein
MPRAAGLRKSLCTIRACRSLSSRPPSCSMQQPEAQPEAPAPPNGQTHWPHQLSAEAEAGCWVRQLDLSGAKAFNPNGNTRPPRCPRRQHTNTRAHSCLLLLHCSLRLACLAQSSALAATPSQNTGALRLLALPLLQPAAVIRVSARGHHVCTPNVCTNI